MHLVKSLVFFLFATLAMSDDVHDTAFQELLGCHISFGSCVASYGIIPVDKSNCARNGGQWAAAFQDARHFKLSPVSPNSALRLVRLASTTSAHTFSQQNHVDSFLFCSPSATYAIVDGTPVPPSAVDFHVPLPDILKLHPSVYLESFTTAPKVHASIPVTRRVRFAPKHRDASPDLKRRLLSEFPSSSSRFHVREAQSLSKTTKSSNIALLVETSVLDSDIVSEWASLPQISWIEPHTESEFFNNEAALIALEGIENPSELDDVESAMPDKVSFWKRGLDGSGQVVAVADTGVDTEHCFFSDLSVNETAMKEERLAAPKGTVHDYPEHRKIIQYISFANGFDDWTSHGSHVAGTVAGQLSFPTQGNNEILGNITIDSGNFQGVAPGTKLIVFDLGKFSGTLEVPDDLQEVFNTPYLSGARIHTNSWGARESGYSQEVLQIDDYVFNHQDMLIVFAAGNAGPSEASVALQASAKNCLAVGSSENSARSWDFMSLVENKPVVCPSLKLMPEKNCAQSVPYFSSRGPTFDNRIKPDIVAPGRYVASAWSGVGLGDFADPVCDLIIKDGTSMSAPVVAGTAAIARQFFTQGFYPSGQPNPSDAFVPMGALLKAVLIDGAETLTGTFAAGFQSQTNLTGAPGMMQGFGRVNLANSLHVNGSFTDNERNLWVTGDFNDMPLLSPTQLVKRYAFSVEPTGDLRVTLVWFDAPAAVNAAKALVNDLNLLVIDPNGMRHFPNNLSVPDRVNTVEKVVIPGASVVAGEYLVEISTPKINLGENQPYSLVVSGFGLEEREAPEPETNAPVVSSTKSPASSSSTKAPVVAPKTDSPTSSATSNPLNFLLLLALTVMSPYEFNF